jgi:hypothetical protein
VKRRARLLLLAVTLAFAWQVDAGAQPQPPAPAHKGDGSVMFFVFESDPLERRAAVLRALEAHFASAPAVEVVAIPRAGTLREQADRAAGEIRRRGHAGAFWVDLSGGDEATLFFVEPDATRILVRRIPWREAEAAAEAVAVVTRSTTDALASGSTIGMEAVVVEPARPAPTTVVPPPAVTPWQTPPFDGGARPYEPAGPPLPIPPRRADKGSAVRLAAWHFGASYAGAYVSKSLPWSSGVEIDGALSLRNGLRVGFAAAGFPPLEVTIDEHRMAVGRASLAGELGYEKTWDFVSLGGTGAPLLELVHRSTAQAGGTLRPLPPELTVLGGVRGTVDLTLRPQASWGFRLSVGPEVVFNPLEFAVREDGAVRVLESFSAIRATALIGVEVRK